MGQFVVGRNGVRESLDALTLQNFICLSYGDNNGSAGI